MILMCILFCSLLFCCCFCCCCCCCCVIQKVIQYWYPGTIIPGTWYHQVPVVLVGTGTNHQETHSFFWRKKAIDTCLKLVGAFFYCQDVFFLQWMMSSSSFNYCNYNYDYNYNYNYNYTILLYGWSSSIR
jgi:hypothetical protein